MVAPKFTEVKKLKKKIQYPRSRYQSWEMSGQTMCQPFRLFWYREWAGFGLVSLVQTHSGEGWMRKQEDAPGCGSVGRGHRFIRTMSFWLSRQFPQNCPPPPLVSKQMPPAFSRTAPITPASRLTSGYDRTTSGERFRASGAHYCLVADASAVIAWAVHFPRRSPWLCFPRARENRSAWVTDQKPGEGNVHFIPYP